MATPVTASQFGAISLAEHHAAMVNELDDIKQELTDHITETHAKATSYMDSSTPMTTNIFKPDSGMGNILPMIMGNQGSGAGVGMGAVGGLLAGALLGGNRGGLLGNNGGDVGGAMAVSQPQANMSIMAGLGDIKQAVAVGTAQMETSQALQSSTIQAQMSSIAAATVAQVSGLKDVVNANTVALMQMNNTLSNTVQADGDKTRALITQQYEANLNRQLQEANAALIELRSEGRTRASEINITTQVSQMQQQQQQQAQLLGLQTGLLEAIQSIKATNQAINIGAGTLTANPTNTNTNTRVN